MKIASPCLESWEGMRGDDRIRFCNRCSLHVYNLSAMSPSEAEELVGQKEGRLCVRFFQRRDGTVLTRDCPVGRRERAVARFSWATAAVLLLGVVATLAAGAGRTDLRRVELVRRVLRWIGLERPERLVLGWVHLPRTPRP